MSDLPPAPPEEDQADPHCETCSSLFHSTADHPEPSRARGNAAELPDFPPDYDPGEADRLTGRTPHGA